MANGTDEAYQVSLNLKLGRGGEPEDFVQTIADMLKSRLRKSGTFPNSVITPYKKESFLVVLGVPKEDLDKNLADLSQKGIIHGYTFGYDISWATVTKEQAETHEIKNLEALLEKRDEELALSARRLEEAQKEIAAGQGEHRLLELRLKEQQQRQMAGLPSAEEKQISLVPQINKKQIIELLHHSSSVVKLIDGYLEALQSTGMEYMQHVANPQKIGEFIDKKFSISSNDPWNAFELLALRRGDPARAINELFGAVAEYEDYLRKYTMLGIIKDTSITIPFFAIQDGQALNYYIPKGSNWGQLSKSMRDKVLEVGKGAGCEGKTERLESIYKVTFESPCEGLAEKINGELATGHVPLWEKLGISIDVISLELAGANAK